MSGTIWYLQSLSLRKNLAGNACVDFSIWFPRPDPRRSRLDASHLVGRIILDPPIQRLNRSIGRSGLLRSANSLLRRPRDHPPYRSLDSVFLSEAASERPPYLNSQLQNYILTFALSYTLTFRIPLRSLRLYPDQRGGLPRTPVGAWRALSPSQKTKGL
jgi:hypothetical protein